MVSKLKWIFLLLAVNSFIFSCTKHHDSPGQPPQPALFDTLGAGWERIKIDTTLNFEDIFFVNSQTGFLCGDKYLGRSDDGGITWKRIIPDSLNESFINLFFVDASHGWVTGDGVLLRTQDGGATWQKAYRGPVFDVQFFDANNGYITNGLQGLYKSSDGGLTIQQVSNTFCSGLFFFNRNEGWISGNYLYKTEDSGVTFLQNTGMVFSPAATLYAVQFTDTLHGWMAGNGGVYRTLDGGATVEALIANTSPGDIQFFDNNNGYILDNNKIYATADGGKTLNQLCSIHKATLIEFHFTDMNHGWATGSGGYVYRYVKP